MPYYPPPPYDAGGDVVGPASATDNAIARYNTTTGKLIQNSAAYINDNGNMGVGTTSTPQKLNVAGSVMLNNSASTTVLTNAYFIYTAGTDAFGGNDWGHNLSYKAGFRYQVFTPTGGSFAYSTYTGTPTLSDHLTDMFSVNGTYGTATLKSTLTIGDGTASNGSIINGSSWNGNTINIYSDYGSAYSFFNRYRGTPSAPTKVLNGDYLGSFGWRGANETGVLNNADGARFSAVAEEDFSTTTQKTAITFYTCPSGSLTAAERMRITGDGKVGFATAAPHSTLHASGSFATALVTKTADYTATVNDHTILVDSTAATRTITLPTAVGIAGREYIVKDWKGQSGTNNITIATTSSQTIDGSTTFILGTNYESKTVVSDGANWSII